MANIRNFGWGTEKSELISGTQMIDDRRVHCKGTYTIKPFVMVPMTLHSSDAEFCIMKTPGMHVVVLKESDSKFYHAGSVMEELVKAPRLEVGDTVDCPQGFGIAMYNTLGFQANVEFQRYYLNNT